MSGYITRTVDPGMCYIHQGVIFHTGRQYRLSFWAKRSGNIDVWAAYQVGTQTIHLPSAISQLSSSSNVFSKVTYIINIPSQSASQLTGSIMLIAGSATGTVWFDDASLEDAASEQNPSMPTYENCLAATNAISYSQMTTSSAQGPMVYRNSRVDVFETSNDRFLEYRPNGYQYFLERRCIDTASSDATASRNASNMFGDDVLQYAYPAPEQAKVYNLQWTLQRLGYDCGEVDGKFGQGTDNAVRAFQQAKGITSDGKVGPITRNALIDSLNALDS